MLLKQLYNTLILLLKIVFFNCSAWFVKKKNYVILVAEFGTEGGALTYFNYMLEYYQSKQISYYLVLSKEQTASVVNNKNSGACLGIIEGREVWRPYFTRKDSLSYNLYLLMNQLQELLFFSKLNVKYRPAYFYFSVTNPEHYLFEFCLSAKIYYACHTLTNDAIDAVKQRILNFFIGKRKKIIAVSHSAGELLLKNWNIKNRNSKFISVVYNYYDPIYDDNYKKENHNQFTVLTIGSVEWYKNPALWCETAKKITERYGGDKVEFIWLGTGSLKKECEQLVAAFPNIYFLGFRRDVEKFYRRTDVYMQPSSSESFGISVVGAMAHKIPCIVSNAGGLVEVVDDNETGFIIVDRNSESYADKLSFLLENAFEKRRMGENGYDKFQRQFTKEKWYANMEKTIA